MWAAQQFSISFYCRPTVFGRLDKHKEITQKQGIEYSAILKQVFHKYKVERGEEINDNTCTARRVPFLKCIDLWDDLLRRQSHK